MTRLKRLQTYCVCFGMIALVACYPSRPRNAFESNVPPAAPDYSSFSSWAAHPSITDSADVVPSEALNDLQGEAVADVFFIHPTTYIGKWRQNKWNGPVDDDDLNEITDALAIRNQATIFNKCFRVFAPRYRQAHIRSYVTKNKADAEKAFKLAYSDVKAAFEFYMEHYNEGRPIVIAGHSQGSSHAIQLLQDYFDGQPLNQQLVAAYIPGMLIRQSQFKSLTPCQKAYQTGCICSWRTMKEGHYPKKFTPVFHDDNVITNPLSWSVTQEPVSASHNLGSVLLDFYDGIHPGLVNAQISRGYLWVNKPKFRGSAFILNPNYHRGDFNFFYLNVRENACDRLSAFTSK